MAGGDQAAESAFAYHEPPIATILNQTGLLVVLSIVNVCLDKLLYCGLIGQLFVGILWGAPGAKWLDREMETVIQQLGYLGLIMLVYEGGLSTSIRALKANFVISSLVAITGIGAPMGLSFILMELISVTPLQAFAAGAALSATSLGTTFTILSTTGLISTRVGVIITIAAMLDDVVGLIMVQIISNLGGSTDSFSSVTVVRPLFVSIGFAVGLLLVCFFILRPVLKKALAIREKMPGFMGTMQFAFLVHTCILVGIVASATYAGTSSLFAAYLSGVVISWFDTMAAESKGNTVAGSAVSVSNTSQEMSSDHDMARNTGNDNEPCSSPTTKERDIKPSGPPTGELIYETYYKQPVIRILTPLFFASIGFAIPITEMFQSDIVWRGVIYAILMTFGKMLTGLWLVRFSSSLTSNFISALAKPFSYVTPFCGSSQIGSKKQKEKPDRVDNGEAKGRPTGDVDISDKDASERPIENRENPSNSPVSNHEKSSQLEGTPYRPSSTLSLPPKPKSLYPPSILGLAMVARGEIGYLIASLAESQGMFSNDSSEGSSDTYLVIVWAISLCTLIGPISVGTFVRRVKKLQQQRVTSGGPDPLGVWGI